MKGRLRITQPSSPLSILFESLLLQVSESTVLCSSTHSRDRSSFSSSFNFIRVPSLFQCQFYLSLFCSKCHRVQCSSTHSRDRSSFSSGFNFIGVPSSPLSILSQFLLLQCKFYLSSFCSQCQGGSALLLQT